MDPFDIIILGGGPAGYTAALYGARAGRSVLLLEKLAPGGQMGTTDVIDNYPGFPQGVKGFQLAMDMKACAERFGAKTKLEAVTGLELAGSGKTVHTKKGDYAAKTVILATGAQPRELGLAHERELRGRGVSYCATCDGAFFQGAEVAIVGGGNTALEDALFLSNNCAAVHLIHRRDQFRGSSILAEAVKKRQNIHLHLNSVVEEITGEEKVAGARLRDVTTGEETRLELSGVFVAVGLAPDNAAFAGQLALDGAGYIQAGEDCRTNLAGVFAAGDTRTKEVRQIITAAADGAVAALGAANYVNSLE